MPEGDTIHKLATALAPELQGQRIEQLWIRRRADPALSQRLITDVRSRGKHLLITLDDGRLIRNHLGLYGSWHRYRPDEPWQKPERWASLVLRLRDRVYVCFNARDVEVTDERSFQSRDQRLRLGPDLTREEPESEALLRRARELLSADTLVVDLLLDQRVAAGIGNVYKCETLFLALCHPSARFGELSPERFARLYATAGRLLRANLGGGPRVTRDPGDGRGALWVYDRAGRPCLRCGGSIRRDPIGANPRSTYWCPSCQASAREAD